MTSPNIASLTIVHYNDKYFRIVKYSTQRIIPYLVYADAPAAIEFLCRAFGFRELLSMPLEDGRIGHAELAHSDNVIMLASSFDEMGLTSPKNLAALHSLVTCHVEDIYAHHARARAEGATIVGEPRDQQGGLMYRAADPEGHRWIFRAPGLQ